MKPAAPGSSAMRSLASRARRSFWYVMASRQPACWSFCAMAQAMLLLFARPKITAVFCASLIQLLSKMPVSRPSQDQFRPVVQKSDPMKRFLDFFQRIPQNHGPAVRTAHRTIGFRQRVQEPLHFRLFERHVHFDRRMTCGRGGDFRLQGFDGNCSVFALDAVQNFSEQLFRVGRSHARRDGLDRHAFGSHWLHFKAIRRQLLRDFFEGNDLSRRKLDHQRHEHALRLHFSRAARFAAQFPADETCGGAAASPNAVPELNGMRCSIGRIGAIVKSNPPSEPTPEPRPISSIGGITARGTADSAGAIPPGNVAFVRAEVCGVAVAALAKLAIGRAPMTAWRIASRARSWTKVCRRKRTSIIAGCTLTSTSPYGISRKSSVAGKTAGGRMLR